MCKEERKFLLRRLCQYEPQTEIEVQTLATSQTNSSPNLSSEPKKPSSRKRAASDPKLPRPRKTPKTNNTKPHHKKFVQPIPLDTTGKPVFPIQLGNDLVVHSLGEVIHDRSEFHCEDAIYPAGYVSTRTYGSLKDPTAKCIYTCKISEANGCPRFEIACDDEGPPIVGGTPDACHALLLQKINEALSLHAVSTKPRGHDFFGLTHPTVLNLIQSSPGTRKCANYRWCKFEVSKNGDHYTEDADASLSFDALQWNIQFCKYKMAPDVLQKPSGFGVEKREFFG